MFTLALAIKAANAAVKSLQLVMLILTGIIITFFFLFTVLVGGELTGVFPAGIASAFSNSILTLIGLGDIDFTMLID